MARILLVGVATLDIVLDVERYPREDDKLRCQSRACVRGGNAANTAVVLAELGHDCNWLGTLGEDIAAGRIRADLRRNHVDCSLAQRIPKGETPTSYVVRSTATATRTIVHFRTLPELQLGACDALPLATFDWVHFEARNIEVTAELIRRCREQARVPCSLELEQSRAGIEALLSGPDLILCSRGFALRGGHSTATSLFDELCQRGVEADLVCGWGAQGAWCRDRDGGTSHVAASTEEPVVDTLGAGDALNAGAIDGLLGGLSLHDALQQAVGLAALKCGRRGFELGAAIAQATGSTHAGG